MTTSHEPLLVSTEHPAGVGEDPIFTELRKNEPLARIRLPHGGDAWLVTRYADIKTVLGDPRFSRAATVGENEPRMMVRASAPDTILSMDAPEHTRLRKLVGKAFTARRMELLRPRAQQVTDEALDAMVAAGSPVDLVRHLALPLPIAMISEMLGVPAGDRESFRGWSDRLLSTSAYSPDEVAEAHDAITDYLAGLVAERRRREHDDLLADLVSARDNEDRLSESELVQFGVTLLVAGHETTANEIANFTYTLLTNPEQLELLRAEADLLPKAVEELLRFVQLGGGVGFARVATEDVELAGGLVLAGESVFASPSPANHDPAAFADAELLDLAREPNPHIAFGFGIHHCLGAQLARMELRVAIGTLLERLPGLRLAVEAHDVPWKSGLIVRGPKELSVSW